MSSKKNHNHQGHHGHHGHHGGHGQSGHHGEGFEEGFDEEWVRYFSEPLRTTDVGPFSPMYGHPLGGHSVRGFGSHLPEFAGERVDASGNVTLCHQPHGDIGDESEYEPNYGAGATGTGMDWDMNMSKDVGPFGSYGLSFGDDMGHDDFGTEGSSPGGSIFGDDVEDPGDEDPILEVNFDPELSPDGVDTFDPPERARTLRNPVIPFGYPERPNFGMEDTYYSGFGPAGVFGDESEGTDHSVRG